MPDDADQTHDEPRFATCIACCYVVSMLQHQSLRAAVDCPRCGASKQFGPGTYVEDFPGYTMAEVCRQRVGKTAR